MTAPTAVVRNTFAALAEDDDREKRSRRKKKNVAAAADGGAAAEAVSGVGAEAAAGEAPPPLPLPLPLAVPPSMSWGDCAVEAEVDDFYVGTHAAEAPSILLESRTRTQVRRRTCHHSCASEW
jgi:hypothetical protein